MNLTNFNTGNLFDAATNLFQQLGIKLNSNTATPLPTREILKNHYKENSSFDAIVKTYFIGIIDDSIFKTTGLFDVNYTYQQAVEQGEKNYNGLMLFALELNKQPTRTEISDLTRAFNRISQKMPVALVLKYTIENEAVISIAISERFKYLQNWRQGEKTGKVIILRDIHTQSTHAGHQRILLDLVKPAGISTYEQLHQQWLQVLDVSILNERFYNELFNWYLWAIRSVNFPNDLDDDKDDTVYNSESVIRLLTRLIFVWFIKEKNLVPNALFDLRKLNEALKGFNPESEESSVYYRAILQNLFFATLNTPMDKDITEENKDEKRRFINTLPRTGNDQYLDQTKYRYQSYFVHPEKALELFSSIPFLNGGLFECLDFKEGGKEIRFDGFSSTEKRQAFAPDKLFFANEFLYDLNAEYGTKGKQYKVKGLIKILEGYKFTITENTPLEEEIALDPELLGKVFENLLASYNPETQTTARKQTGSFYTPREIVNYMVDESLIACFKQQLAPGDETFETKLRDMFSHETDLPEFTETETDQFIKAISEVKILDPACGSGAFPMGILHRLVDLLTKLDPENIKWKEQQKQRAVAETAEVFNNGDITEREIRLSEINRAFDLNMNYPDYARKLFLIENCIYGVDIQQIAIQISKLRFFISLIVDQKVNDNKPNRNILSMPNLETKFVAANTLIGLEKPQQLTLMAGSAEKLEKDLVSIRHKIFFTRKYSEKKTLKKQEKAKREELQKVLEQTGYTKNVASQMAGWNPFDPMQSAKFFDSETMFGFDSGFDVVIGNPPYIKEYTYKSAFDGVRNSPYYQGKMDLWYLFACKNLDNLRRNSGVLCFIATNNWTTNSGASKMRTKVLNDSTVHFILDFGSYMIFESADIQTMVMLLRNDNSNDNYNFELRRLVGDKFLFNDVLDLILKRQTEKTEFLTPQISKEKLKDKTFTFSNNDFDSILDKLNAKKNFQLDDKNEVAQGMVLPQDFLNKSNQKILGEKFKVGQGIFVLSDEEMKNLNFTNKELELIKPYYTTTQLHKWYAGSKNSQWIIYTDSKFKYLENIKPYPNIRKHLDKFQTVITSDNKPYGLHRSRDEYFFKGEKIVVLRKCANEPVFTFTDFDCYVSATFYLIKSKRLNLKYLTAILNSKISEFWLRNKGKMQGSNYQLDKEPLLEIPIVKAREEEIIKISRKVDQILAAKAANPKTDITALEKQIDVMVYKLYELTYDDVLVIDPEFGMNHEEYEAMENEN